MDIFNHRLLCLWIENEHTLIGLDLFLGIGHTICPPFLDFRVRGSSIDIIPVNEKESGIRVELDGDIIEAITIFEPLTGVVKESKKTIAISPASHFVTSPEKLEEAIKRIEKEKDERLQYFKDISSKALR